MLANILRNFIIIYSVSELFRAQLNLAQTESSWGRDPFKSPLTKVKEEKVEVEKEIIKIKPTLTLSAILRGQENLVIINGEVLGLGEIIEGRKVIEINDDRVILIDEDGEKEELVLEESFWF